MPWLRVLAATVAIGAAGCRIFEPGLPIVQDGAPDDVLVPDVAAPPSPPADAARSPEAAPAHDLRPDEPSPPGHPAEYGCADGTREGFASVAHWGNIAGCAGAWSVPGLLGTASRAPGCGRAAGNHGQNPAGEGCSVADLCAIGWHVCRDAGEVSRQSGSGCESAVVGGPPRFFLVLAGASPQGICSPDRAAMNDLHGCGDLGQPQSVACQPLSRRMTFADCQATRVWSCGDADDHLSEAALVTKIGAAYGGALCCRDN